MKNYVIIALSYCASYFPILFNKGVFWDDWTIYKVTPFKLQAIYENFGYITTYHFQKIIQQYDNAPQVAHIIIFTCLLIASLLNYKTLKKLINIDDALILSLLTTTIPYFTIRLYMSTMQYVFGLMFLSIACCLYVHKRKFIGTLFAIYSFTFLPSAVFMFFALVVAMRDLRSIWFWLSVVVYACLKYTCLAPLTVGYNSFELTHILVFPFSLIESFANSLFRLFPFVTMTVFKQSYAVVFLIVFTATWHILKDKKLGFFNAWYGALLFIIGITPYLLVGKIPMVATIESRHEALLGLGASIIVIGLIQKIIKKRFWMLVISIVLALYVTTNIKVYLQIL